MSKGLSNWAFGHAILMLAATIIAMIGHAIFILVWAAVVSIVVLIVTHHASWRKLKPIGGYANHVTFARFLLLVVTLALREVLDPIPFVALIVLVIIADGLDGFLARKFNHSSQFGAVFDMEVDAFLALAFTLLNWINHPEAWWILLAGALRYLFVILYRVLRWHLRQQPSMFEAKVIAVVFFCALLVPFIMSWDYAKWITTAGCVLVAFSFLKEFYMTGLQKNRV